MSEAKFDASGPTADQRVTPERVDHAVLADEDLARRAGAGDGDCLRVLLLRHSAQVSRLLWRFSGNQEETKDLTQEVFVRVIRGLATWRGEKPFLFWLRRVTVNVGRDYCRRRSTRRNYVSEEAVEEVMREGGPDPGADPAARLAMKELRGLLRKLAPEDQIVLSLHYLEGWDLKEIAEAHGWPVALMKLKVFRARRRFKKCVEEQI